MPGPGRHLLLRLELRRGFACALGDEAVDFHFVGCKAGRQRFEHAAVRIVVVFVFEMIDHRIEAVAQIQPQLDLFARRASLLARRRGCPAVDQMVQQLDAFGAARRIAETELQRRDPVLQLLPDGFEMRSTGW
jgi:hypothetical protein